MYSRKHANPKIPEYSQISNNMLSEVSTFDEKCDETYLPKFIGPTPKNKLSLKIFIDSFNLCNLSLTLISAEIRNAFLYKLIIDELIVVKLTRYKE
jgi:hypothetical protein